MMPSRPNNKRPAGARPGMSSRTRISVTALVLAASVLAALGVRWFIRARTMSAYSSCINGLRQIDGAVQQWALDHHKTTNDMPTWADLAGPDGYIRRMPVCPRDGTYLLGRVADLPR